MPIRETKRIEIRWGDMDAYGHVSNPVYLRYVDETLYDFYTGLLGTETTLRLVTKRVDIEFIRALTRDDDEVVVARVRVVRIGSSSVTTETELRSDRTGEVAAKATTVMVYTDEAHSGAAPLPDAARTALEARTTARI